MRVIVVFTCIVLSLNSFAQSIETITQKISNKICDCIKNDMVAYEELKPEFNRCYDKEFNFIFDLVDTEEHKILIQQGALTKVKNGIIPTLNISCEKIRTLIELDLGNTFRSSLKNNSNYCPISFSAKHLKKINKLIGNIIAFDGLVTQMQIADNDKPYYLVELEDGNTIWISSTLNIAFEDKDKSVRILGYVVEIGDEEMDKFFNQTNCYILPLCVVNLESKKLAAIPGAELQVKEWINGSVPKAKEK